MKFLVDAQLPFRLSARLSASGHDALHTRELPNGNGSTDTEILVVAAREQRIVITKNADFVNSYQIKQQPEKLLLISTGNIANADLDTLITSNLDAIVLAFASSNFVELTRTSIIIHA